MSIQQLSPSIIIYGIPGIILFSIACVIITQNYRSTTNRLIAVLVFLYSFIFFEEFIRNLLPASYDYIMLHLSFGPIGILIISITFHFFIHITKFAERIKIPLYPAICYIPFVIISLVLLSTINDFTPTENIQEGMWTISIFNLPYYQTLLIANIIMVVFIAILLNGLKHTTSPARRKILRLFIGGTFFGLVITFVFEYPNFGWPFPPHPFLILGIIFPILLTISAVKFNLLPSAVQKYRTMFNLIPISITLVNSDWEILELNDYSRKTIFQHGYKTLNLLDFVCTDENKKVLHNFIELLQEKVTLHNYPITFLMNNTLQTIHYTVEASTISLEEEKLFYLVWRDVTEEIENDRLIEHLAYHDALTTLHNRAYFVPKVKEQLTKLAASSSKEAALILIDLNRFKRINDTYGHAIGDQVLQHTAMLLKQSVRVNDLVARLGGDEFVVFLENLPTQRSVVDWRKRFEESFTQNLFVSGSITLQIKPSIGIAHFPIDADNFEDLFQLADSKMYEHKLQS
ncbi:diguanylate cyclase [Sporosarcina sp. YIM B06819]|uniref:histidine kinase N-terminal 7TM domain-containing diguanylate cyclase n=1 Tax=Sporosarcina sp. YIM B06819 TaxID=3081769 RepID=UPI00298C02D2|nr:diguanylate cyclase [Sporosarcina sp. YIM B06819]